MYADKVLFSFPFKIHSRAAGVLQLILNGGRQIVFPKRTLTLDERKPSLTLQMLPHFIKFNLKEIYL